MKFNQPSGTVDDCGSFATPSCPSGVLQPPATTGDCKSGAGAKERADQTVDLTVPYGCLLVDYYLKCANTCKDRGPVSLGPGTHRVSGCC